MVKIDMFLETILFTIAEDKALVENWQEKTSEVAGLLQVMDYLELFSRYVGCD
jgi:hypothetical protein